MPTMKPTGGLLSSLETSPLERARMVFKNRDRYGRPAYPDRPELGASDGELIRIGQATRERKPVSQADKETLQIFGEWRSAVFKLECDATANLELLGYQVVTLEEQKDNEKAQKAAQRLRQFIRQSHGCTLPDRKLLRAEIRPFAERASVDMELLPKHLRTLDPFDAPKDVRIPTKKKMPDLKQLSTGEAYGEEEGEDNET